MLEHPLRLEDFAKYDWQSLVDHAERHGCLDYFRLFHARRRELGEAGDELGEAVFHLLAYCTASSLDSASRTEPFPWMVAEGTSRILISSDIPDRESTLLSDLAKTARDPELRARLADIAWLTLRDHHMACIAIDSYLESALRLDTEEVWRDANDRLERALRLAAQLGSAGQAKFDAVVGQIESTLAKGDATEERRFQPRLLMELLIEFRAGDFDQWSTLAETLAETAELEEDWHRAEAYWETKAAWDRRRNDDTARQAAQIRAAETRVNLARELLQKDPPEYMVASIHLQKAMEGMRQAGEASRAENLHRELLKYQKLALSQMQRFSQEIDITSYVADAIEAVRGKPLDSALFTLVTMQDSPSVSRMRHNSERSGEQFVLLHLFPTMQLDHEGRIAARKPSLHSDDPREVEAAIQADMFEFARQCQEGCVAMFIEPARRQIVLGHHIRQRDLQPIVSNNPLVAPGRAELVLRGLYAGLIGDFIVACHLLIPQIEHSIRHVLNEKGVTTTSLSSDGIQEERDLSWLLKHQKTTAIWGEDLTFDLRGLLVERFGSNLRNKLAHGLAHERELDSWQGVYLWWIALRFYMLPILMRISEGQSSVVETEAPSPGNENGEQSSEGGEDPSVR